MAATDIIRTPHDVARMLRETAKRIAARPADDLLLSPEAQASFAVLFRSWADTLDKTSDAERLTDAPGERPLSVELDDSADTFAAEAMLSGDGGVILSARDARDLVAWLRRAAFRAAHLYVAAKGFQFFRAEDLPRHPDDVAPPSAELAALDPSAVVPGLETGAGGHVTYGLLARLAARRRDGGMRPCDTEDGNPGSAA